MGRRFGPELPRLVEVHEASQKGDAHADRSKQDEDAVDDAPKTLVRIRRIGPALAGAEEGGKADKAVAVALPSED